MKLGAQVIHFRLIADYSVYMTPLAAYNLVSSLIDFCCY